MYRILADMAPLKIVVVGTIRNGAKAIRNEIQSLKRILEPLAEVFFFVVESDSSDDTPKILDNISKEITNFSYKSLGKLESKIPNRIERLIFCRNIYVREIRESLTFQEADFVIVVDLDGVNKKLNTKEIHFSLSRKVTWAALSANQSGKYYDLLALRHKYWCPNNVFDEYHWLREMMYWKKAKKRAIYEKMYRIPRNMGLIPVDSAFGGFAIYRTHYLLNYDYSRLPRDESSDIDHVILNRRIVESGGRIYIDSQLINTGWTRHSLSSFSLFRGLVDLKRIFIRE